MSRPVEVSVLLPAYNAERFILASVQSVLAQTFEDFELLVVDDGSTDRTREILGGIDDPRLRVLENGRNLGVTGSLNRALAAAKGRLVARLDADDLCTPTRFARQKAFLDEHGRAVLVGTAMSVLVGGKVRFSRAPAPADPAVLRWMLHVGNPVGHPSVMFRADAVQRMGRYLDEEVRCAEDFDFSHRMLAQGELHVLPDHLTIYRHHDRNLTRLFRDEMVASTASVLRRVYADLLGPHEGPDGCPIRCPTEDEDGAGLVARHALANDLVEGTDRWHRLRHALDRVHRGFVARHAPTAAQAAAIDRHLAGLWHRMVQRSLAAGRLNEGRRAGTLAPPGGSGPAARIAASVSAGLLRQFRPAVRTVRRLMAGQPAAPSPDFRLDGLSYRPVPPGQDRPPTLYVVVDTEAEFDWNAPIDRCGTRVTSAARQNLAQDILDGHGIRPVYVVDYPISSQPEGHEPLRRILDRRGCLIGAHLHPWTTPPFEEVVSERNSFAGNLSPGLERRKLQALVASIEGSFGVKPLFFKAGRYGLGPTTIDSLEQLGFQVDFSIIPLTDLQRRGGPDFRHAGALPYQLRGRSVVSFPMMRGQVGLLAPLPLPLHGMVESRIGRRLHLPGLLSRAGLLDTVTLTPEGMTVSEQVRLIRTMERRGHRTFVLHYHSPSLGGHTPYVRSDAELKAFLANLRAVCRFFLTDFGGLAGNPVDLLHPSTRHMAFPAERVTA